MMDLHDWKIGHTEKNGITVYATRGHGDEAETVWIASFLTPETAALIVSVPDLLRALLECRKALNYHGIVDDTASFMADAAIAKATTEQ
jgi:hypothetical protein